MYTSTVLILSAVSLLILMIYIVLANYFRIRDVVRKNGGSVRKITWTPYADGWFGEPHAIIYRVEYYDRERRLHSASCWTNAFRNAIFKDDRILEKENEMQLEEKKNQGKSADDSLRNP